jgi:hypothetical protein
MTDEIATWVRAQIAERQDVAAAAKADDGASWITRHGVADSGLSEVLDSVRYAVASEVAHGTAEHIALNDPDAVLAQCEAHEKLLRPHNIVHDDEHGFFCNGCGYSVLELPRTRHSLDYCPMWRGVALAFQHRPGYREEWRP